MVDEEMVDAVQVFLDTIRRDYKPGDVLVVEQRFDLSSWYPGLFGTCDAVLYRPSTGELRVYDLKYGRGVPVEVERSEEHTSELQSLMRISYAVFCLKQKTSTTTLSSISDAQ